MESVSIVIFNDARSEVLLVKRRDIPVWVLPGGGIDSGESPESAARREAREETGCEVSLRRKVAEYLPVNRLTRFTHLFEGEILSGQPTATAECAELSFFPLSRLPKLLPPPFPGWIADAQALSPTLIRKKIEGVSYGVLLTSLFSHPLLVFRFLLTKLGIHLNT
jgi:8-oxo-dGTP diphosphatase